MLIPTRENTEADVGGARVPGTPFSETFIGNH